MNETIDPDSPAGKPQPTLRSIAAAERDTGLSKDTLRMWERRYGFPSPLRDGQGERAYPIEQVARLRLLKRLLDAGHRPGRIVHLDDEELGRLVVAPAAERSDVPSAAAPDIERYMPLLIDHDVVGLRRQLGAALAGRGLALFVTQVVAPLCTQIGDAWMRGQIEIWQEHLATEALQAVLRAGIARLPEPAARDRPRVVLGTLTGEPHGLGLLMAEAMFAQEGARCLSLGVHTPLWDVVLAARTTQADIVALSFTGCLAPGQVSESLAELRAKLPRRIEVWAGGSAQVLRRRPTEGVLAVPELGGIRTELARWRSHHSDDT